MQIKILLTALILSIWLNLSAQVVTTMPSFATEKDSITIIFDATKGDQGLKGYTGNVYAHTGVTINGKRWQNVIGNWGDDYAQPKLIKVATDLYHLVIGKPHDFYNVNQSTKITELSFVFRGSGSSAPTGRDFGGADIFVPLYEQSLSVALIEPSEDFSFVKLNQSINITAISKLSTQLSLYANNQLISSTEKDSITYSFLAAEAGKSIIKAVAKNSAGQSVSDSLVIIVRKETAIAELPDGIKYGINYIDNSTVTLALNAPYKEFVYVGGDFNDWEIDPNYELKLTPDKSVYWITLTGLTPNKEYGFQYLVDGNIVIQDPYADKILDPWNDSNIPASVYPNRMPYPFGKTDGIVSVFQTNQKEYAWKVNNFKRPPKDNLVIYELLVRDFVSTHSYKTLTDTLDYFVKLGINAIELMPVNEFEGNESWGYNPMMYFAPDKYYGTKDDLKAFIDAAHEKGIAVILDMVLNHAYGLNPMVRLYFDNANNRPSPANPWFNITSPNPVFSWGYDFNHERQATKDFIDRVNKYWLEEYKVDGFRFDFTKGFTNTSGDGSAYDNDRIAILKRMSGKIWEYDSTAYVILEHFAQNTEEKVLSDYGMMLWGNINGNYNEATMGYNESGKSNFSGVSYQTRGWTKPNLVGYMESHDEERLMYKNLQYGNFSGDYIIKNLHTALDRIKLAAAFFITVPGPKMLWQFQELGYDYSIDFNGRVGNKPIRWDYYEDVYRRNLNKTIAALINLKTKYPVFGTRDFTLNVSGSVKKISLNHETMSVLIVGNFDVVEKSISYGFKHTGKWYNYFEDDSIDVTDTEILVSLKPGEFKLLTDVKLPAPEANILTGIKKINSEIPSSYSLSQNYPNPFNPSTKIKYSISAGGNVSLKIYDMLGQEIKTLVEKYQNEGVYEVSFASENFTSGVYFYRLEINGFKDSKKFILLK